jgi:2-phosphosulfolactate phosphatase
MDIDAGSAPREVRQGDRLLSPSPDGPALSRATGRVPTLCGCLRNAAAVGGAAQRLAQDATIAVIAAGERWPENSLCPAIEDWLGAGAVISAMSGALSTEARLARQAIEGAGSDIGALLHDSVSGRELAAIDHAGDVEVALERGSSSAVPLLGWAGHAAF